MTNNDSLRLPISSELLSQINQLEARTIVVFKEYFGITLFSNDEESIACICDFIELEIFRNQLTEENKNAWVSLIGAFLGQTIIKVYGGQWVNESNLSIELKDRTICYPIDKVVKQLENGKEDSIYYYFTFISEILEKKLPFQQTEQ